MRRIVLLFILSLSFHACEKERNTIAENTGLPLISMVLSGNDIFMIYTYNNANLVSEEKSKFHYTGHNYNSTNLLKSSEFYNDPAMWSSSSSVIEEAMSRKEWVNPSNTEKSLTQTFYYNEDQQLIKKVYTRPSVNNSEFSEFIWENDRIIRQTMYWKGKISGYFEYFYDSKGNLTKQVKYFVPDDGIPQLATTTEFEYDNMKNPFLAFRRLMTPGINTNPNNIIKETYTIHSEVDQWTDKVQVTEYHYEYNHSGYPVKVNGDLEYVYN